MVRRLVGRLIQPKWQLTSEHPGTSKEQESLTEANGWQRPKCKGYFFSMKRRKTSVDHVQEEDDDDDNSPMEDEIGYLDETGRQNVVEDSN